ncbi:MAG: adenylate/guanylate cyclase domain-containing protein [Burkholderiales bacterium]|nr:adenylate/guanylate cyclase domain-containing protein [Burkholderiales bacterium]
MLKTLFPFIQSATIRWYAALTLLLLAMMAGELFGLRLLATTESRLGDVYLRHHAASYKADPDIVVVDIDDASLLGMQKIAGLWAWKREVHAFMTAALVGFAPRALVFDINFNVPDLAAPKSDAMLSDQIRDFPHAYMQVLQLQDASSNNAVPISEIANSFAVQRQGKSGARIALQLPMAIERKAWRLGLVNSLNDGDGVLRRYRLYSDVAGWYLPSLPARVAQDFNWPLPTGKDVQLSWPNEGHQRFTYADLFKTLTEDRPNLTPEVETQLVQLFRNKIIVIGASAGGLFDHHLTPLGPNYPGVDILAVALDNLKNGHTLRQVGTAWPFLLGLILIILLALAFQWRINPILIGSGLTVMTGLAVLLADQMVLRYWMLPVATPFAFAWAWFLSAAIAGYLRERRTRDRTVSLFGRFLNPEVVRKIVDHGETVESLSGQTREISLLFSDIRGFTTLSESRPPDEVVKLLNRYFERQVEVVWRHGGTLDKFIGDCIMAFWGAPLDDPDHAKRAVAAALEMEENLLAFKDELRGDESGLPDFDVGIGVHTGTAVVGFIGAKRKLDYTAIGDAVNLASRVEGLTKGISRILVTKDTMLACQESGFDFILRGAFPVKGRAAEVELYEPKRKNQ